MLDQLVEYERRLGLAWTSGDAPNQRFPVQPVALGKVQESLEPGEVLLEYVLDEPDGETLMRDIERDHGTDLAHASYRDLSGLRYTEVDPNARKRAKTG